VTDRYDELLTTIESAVAELRALVPQLNEAERSLREAIQEATHDDRK
jgi:hypothetical protein